MSSDSEFGKEKTTTTTKKTESTLGNSVGWILNNFNIEVTFPRYDNESGIYEYLVFPA